MAGPKATIMPSPDRLNATAKLGGSVKMRLPPDCTCQCLPLSEEETTVLYSPTAQALPRGLKATSKKAKSMKWLTVQVEPPFSVHNRVPFAPTAHAASEFMTATLKSESLTGDGIFAQVPPPSFVRKMVPPSPTIHPTSPPGANRTLYRSYSCTGSPNCLRFQLFPSLWDSMSVPFAPTTKAVPVVPKATPKRESH